jgi:hypothetical protein
MDVDSEDEIPTVNVDEKTNVEPQPDSEEEKESADSDDGNEQAVKAAEDVYLSEWTKQWNANIEGSKKRKECGVSCCCLFPPPNLLSVCSVLDRDNAKRNIRLSGS